MVQPDKDNVVRGMKMGVKSVYTGIHMIWSKLNQLGRGYITEEAAMNDIANIVAATQQMILNNKRSSK